MAFHLRANDALSYAGAVLAPQASLHGVISGLPGLVGAWDAADWSGSGSWTPRIGTGSILPAVAGTPPSRTARDGRVVARFGTASKAWLKDANGADVLFSGLTFASRAFYRDATTNFQKLFDLGVPEFFFRSSLPDPIWQWAGLGTDGRAPIAAPVVGWHKVLFSKGGTAAATLSAEGGEAVNIGAEGAALDNAILQIGDAAAATSAACDLTRIIICNSGALTPAQKLAVQTWVSL